ncbi:uncharacterized protein LOC110394586 [Numida meleagris]|uniref:uncharacterized protein LOC110394586 n=1 Tax=Numida meleagris TaxID=8996 RepID=UPI000B3DEE4D|nr:uncharacterized protein LOC110394586 [Numida meleagris]
MSITAEECERGVSEHPPSSPPITSQQTPETPPPYQQDSLYPSLSNVSGAETREACTHLSRGGTDGRAQNADWSEIVQGLTVQSPSPPMGMARGSEQAAMERHGTRVPYGCCSCSVPHHTMQFQPQAQYTQIAQWVEYQTLNPRVVGSSPTLGILPQMPQSFCDQLKGSDLRSDIHATGSAFAARLLARIGQEGYPSSEVPSLFTTRNAIADRVANVLIFTVQEACDSILYVDVLARMFSIPLIPLSAARIAVHTCPHCNSTPKKGAGVNPCSLGPMQVWQTDFTWEQRFSPCALACSYGRYFLHCYHGHTACEVQLKGSAKSLGCYCHKPA